MVGPGRRLTQRDIAQMTGVSQATVSLVLNGRADGDVKIAPDTRDRVLRAIRDSGYVANPIARRLAASNNQILGVFGYEPIFGPGSAHFYHPFLVGIEEQAEALGSDLLLLTSAPLIDGRRRIFHDGNRLLLADGCILLGRSLDPDDLRRLLADGLPFVSVGRRDEAGGPVPYVGADYPAAVGQLVHRVAELGHTRIAYLGEGAGVESWTDRMTGFNRGAEATGMATWHRPGTTPAQMLDVVIEEAVTAVLVEDLADAESLLRLATDRGLRVPADLSVLTLGQSSRDLGPGPVTDDPDAPGRSGFSGFEIPRQQMGREAVEVLMAVIDGAGGPSQRLLPCRITEGSTLGPPPGIPPRKRARKTTTKRK